MRSFFRKGHSLPKSNEVEPGTHRIRSMPPRSAAETLWAMHPNARREKLTDSVIMNGLVYIIHEIPLKEISN